MDKVIVDTDILIEFFRGNEKVAQFLIEEIMIERITTTYITIAELIKGATDRESQLKLYKLIADIPVLYHTLDSSSSTLKLVSQYHLSHGIQLADASIAAIAIHYKLPLLTLNTKDFKYIKPLHLIPHSLKPKSSWF